VRTLMYSAQEQLHSFLRNFPNRPISFLLRFFIFPRGRTYSAPSDELGRKLVDLITTTGEARNRLSEQAYTTLEPGNPLGLLQEALQLKEELAPLELKLRQAYREGLISSAYLGYQVDDAEQAKIISNQEATQLRRYHQKVLDLLSVDDFAPEEVAGGTISGEAATSAPKPARKRPAAKQPAGKKKTKATKTRNKKKSSTAEKS